MACTLEAANRLFLIASCIFFLIRQGARDLSGNKYSQGAQPIDRSSRGLVPFLHLTNLPEQQTSNNSSPKNSSRLSANNNNTTNNSRQILTASPASPVAQQLLKGISSKQAASQEDLPQESTAIYANLLASQKSSSPAGLQQPSAAFKSNAPIKSCKLTD